MLNPDLSINISGTPVREKNKFLKENMKLNFNFQGSVQWEVQTKNKTFCGSSMDLNNNIYN